MKLILDAVVLIARFGVFIGGMLAVVFVLYLLLGPAQRAWEEAEQLQARRSEVIAEQERLSAEMAALERERARVRGDVQAVRTEREVVSHTRLPLAEQAIGVAQASRAQAEQAHRAGRARLAEMLGEDHGFGVYRGDPAGAERWAAARVAALERRCALRWTQREFWGAPLSNLSARLTCDQALERARALRAWGARVARIAQEQAELEAWLADADARVEEARARVDGLRGEASHLAAAEESLVRDEESMAHAHRVHGEQLDALAAEERALDRALGGFSGWLAAQHGTLLASWAWVVEQWQAFWWRGLLFVLALWATPYLWRTVMFWGVAPLLGRVPPIRLLPGEQRGRIHLHPSARVAPVEVRPGEAVFARAGHVRQVEAGVSRTRWFYDLSFPFLSYVAGLFLLTEVRAPAGSERSVRLTLAATGEHSADTYVLRIDLEDHPGLVIAPRNLVAVTEGLALDARWRPGNLHAWARGQLRYVSLRGTGSLWIEGFGDVHGETLDGAESHQGGEAYLCFDARLESRTRRRETFWPYLLGRVPLLEVGLRGHGVFAWQKSAGATGLESPVVRAWNAFWNIVGKFLGF